MLEFAARLTEMDAAYESLRHTVVSFMAHQPILTDAPPLEDTSDQAAFVWRLTTKVSTTSPDE